MSIKWTYSLTGNDGETLFEALRQRDFDKMVEAQAEAYETQAIPNGDWREMFIDEKLWKTLNGDDIDAIVNNVPDLQDKMNKNIREWLYKHECPIVDEAELIREWAWERASSDVEDGFLWDHVDKNDDVEVALGFGLIKYPPFDDEKQIYVEGGRDCIPADVANEIWKLSMDVANEQNRKHGGELECKAVEDMIFVDGFYCDIHGDRTEYEKPVKKSEIVTCPACGHPICPVCANCYSKDPATEEKSREYMESCDSVSGMAYCGNCGDYSQEFMLGFLKLVGAPIPKEYENPIQIPRENVEYLATATVNALPDFQDIFRQVKEQWEKGTTGIIKVQHPTGEIWGWTDRYPDRWVVTILYPEER